MPPTRANKHPVFVDRILPVLFVVLYSSGYVASKTGIAFTDPFTFQSLRLAIPIPIFLTIIYFFKADWPKKATEYVHLSVIGILIHGFCFTGMLIAYEWGMDAGTVGLIMALHPVLASVGAAVFLGENSSFKQALGLLLGTIGVVFIVGQKVHTGDNTYSGLFLTILCLFSMVAGVLYQKRFVAHMNLMTGSLIQHFSAFIPVCGLMLAFEPMTVNWTFPLLGSLLWMGIVLSLGSWLLFYILIRKRDVSHSQSYFFLVPPTITLLAWAFFDEDFGSYFILSIALIMAGIWAVTRQRLPRLTGREKTKNGMARSS